MRILVGAVCSSVEVHRKCGRSEMTEEVLSWCRLTMLHALWCGAQVMCLSVAVANVEQSKSEIELNIQLAANFLASLLKKNWQNIKVRRGYVGVLWS